MVIPAAHCELHDPTTSRTIAVINGHLDKDRQRGLEVSKNRSVGLCREPRS